MSKRRKVTIAVIIGVIVLLAVAALVWNHFSARPAGETAVPLTGYWTEDSVPAAALRDYVTMVTDPDDKENFIPVKDRIAVFAMDGTLTCETS